MAPKSDIQAGELRYFKEFLKNNNNKDLIFKMKTCLSELRIGLSNLQLAFFTVLQSNASTSSSVNFDSARCTVVLKEDEKGPLLIPIGRVFSKGYYVLDNFLGGEPYLPNDEAKLGALSELLQFLSSGKFLISLVVYMSSFMMYFVG